MLLAANGTVGGLVFLCLILIVTVIVFGIKFLLDHAEPAQDAGKPSEKAEKPDGTSATPSEAPQPLYVIREAKPAARKRRPKAPMPASFVLPKNAVFRLESPEDTKEKVS